MTGPAEGDLTELRTVVARAREQVLRLTGEAQAGRAALQEQRAELRAERERLERDALAAYRNGTLGHQERALVQRIDRGETTWRAVAAGTDDHWTATALREAVGEQVEEQVEQMREDDPDFVREHEAAIRSAEEMARRARS